QEERTCAIVTVGFERARLFRAIAGAQSRIFGDRHTDDAYRVTKRGLDAIKDKPRELLTCWDELAIGELGNIEVDVTVIEAVSHLRRQHTIDETEIDDHPRLRIDGPRERYVTHVAVAVKALPRARPKDALVTFIRPVRTAVSVRRGEGHPTREKSGHFGGKR